MGTEKDYRRIERKEIMKLDKDFRKTSESFPVKTLLTRKEYMDGDVTHDQYYNQFVTQDIMDTILVSIGVHSILESTDPHFNDIDLKRWDRCAVLLEDKVKWPKDDGPSLAGLVCVAKAGAKEFIRIQAKGSFEIL